VHLAVADRVEEERQQHPGPLDLVGLNPLLSREALQELRVRLEVEIFPGGLASEDEVVEPGEQLEGRAADGVRPRVVREAAAELGVERRAALAVEGLLQKDLSLGATQASRARPSRARRARRRRPDR
jgi:hypothetical protein